MSRPSRPQSGTSAASRSTAKSPALLLNRLWVGNLLAIGILLTLIGWILVDDRETHHAQAAIRTRNLAQLLDQNINALLDKTDMALRTVAREISRQAAQGKPDTGAIKELLAHQKSLLPEVDRLRVSDTAGGLLYGENSPSERQANSADRQFFIEARNRDSGLVIDGPLQSRLSGKWIMVLARRLSHPDGTFLGVVSAAIDVEHFRRLFAGMDLGSRGSVVLRHADLRVVARVTAGDTEQPIGSNGAPALFIESIRQNPEAGGFIAPGAFDGIERRVAYRRVGGHPLYVIVGLSTADYLDDWRSNAFRTLAFATLAILVMILSSWLVYGLWCRRLQSEQHFRFMVEGIRDQALFGLDLQGRIATWNEGARRLTGYRADEVIGRHFSIFCRTAGEAQDLPSGSPSGSGEAGSLQREGWRVRQDGSTFMANEIFTVLADAAGAPRGFTVILQDITEKRLAEQTAANAHALLREAVDSIAVGFVIYNPDGRLVICNGAFINFFKGIRDVIVPGAHYEDLLRAGAKRGLFPAAAGRIDEWVKERLELDLGAPGVPVEVELKSGLRLLVVRYRTGSGHTVANYIDITELHRHQRHLEQLVEARTAELKASVAQFRILVEQAPTAIAMLDRNLDYLAASRRWIQEQGKDLGPLIGLNYRDAHPNAALRWRDIQSAALDGAVLNKDEDLWEHPDGSQQWLRWAVYPWMDEHGAIGGIIMSVEDITDRKGAEEQLLESEIRFRATFEQAAVGLAHVALDGTFLRVNQKLCAILGRERQELLALDFQALTHPADLQADLDAARQLLSGAIPSYTLEKRYLRTDGSAIWCSLTGGLVRTPAGEPDYFIAVVEDIQGRKETEAALAEERASHQRHLEQQVAERTAALMAANRELQGFTYAASHDMRAPLGRINSFGALLERNYRERLEGEGLMFLDFIRRNTTRVIALIDDLLEHAQIEQKILDRQAVDLLGAVQVVLNEREMDFRENGIQVRLDLSPAKVNANPLGLTQVLRNLLENAIKYSSRENPPVVEIGGRETDGLYQLWVRDNGVGFDMVYHDRIFEIFRRLHTYEEFPGSGIGLALVKKAMERMGGRVWAESAPGQGATFRLELPVALEAAA